MNEIGADSSVFLVGDPSVAIQRFMDYHKALGTNFGHS